VLVHSLFFITICPYEDKGATILFIRRTNTEDKGASIPRTKWGNNDIPTAALARIWKYEKEDCGVMD
jgi:hypothetical protein